MKSHKSVRKRAVSSAIDRPTNEWESTGSDAIDSSVVTLTPLPYPSAKSVMPVDLRIFAVRMAAALPP